MERSRGPEKEHFRRGLAAEAKGRNMINTFDVKSFEEFQKFGKDSVDSSIKAFGAASKSAQAIAAESADYSKRAFEESTAAMEKLFSAKSIESAIEIQQSYLKSAYDGFVTQATKMSELYTDLAKEAYKPYEGYMAKMAPAK
jgi:hypothetical protein